MSGDYLTDEIKNEICDRIAEGESLVQICADSGMPARSTVFKYLRIDDEFADKYARAREAQADSFFDEIVSIADVEEDTNKARVRIDARKWAAGKLRPKKYGDRLAIGGDDDMDPIKTQEVGGGAAKVLAAIEAIAERSRAPSDPDA